MLRGLEARVLAAVWEVYKKEAPHGGRSELQYGACVHRTHCIVHCTPSPRAC